MQFDQLDSFTFNYLQAMLWTESEDGGPPLYLDDIAGQLMVFCVRDCANFQKGNAELLQAACNVPNYTMAQAGHDFWLTRQGYGAGFWDRGLGVIGEKLSEAARKAGEVYSYIDDEGKLRNG